MAIDVSGWSCDERNRKGCRNAHGCHCREITALRQENEQLKAADRDHLAAKNGMEKRLTAEIERLKTHPASLLMIQVSV